MVENFEIFIFKVPQTIKILIIIFDYSKQVKFALKKVIIKKTTLVRKINEMKVLFIDA